MKNVVNPYELKKQKRLQSAMAAATLAGGTEGSVNETPVEPPASSVEPIPSIAEEMDMALAALSDMFSGYLQNDRKMLDTGFENLVGIIEEWRDAVPKA